MPYYSLSRGSEVYGMSSLNGLDQIEYGVWEYIKYKNFYRECVNNDLQGM